ncbi:MAG: PfaD family polyunsaturated fatty acid/polyketide biosynthesis protein [Polyangiales bacterium]
MKRNDPPSRAVFLVSGGARGITAACVTALARAHGGTFLLAGRTPLDPDPSLDEHAPEDALRRQVAASLNARGEKATPIAVERALKGVRARREIAETLARIEHAGGRARYVAVDVTDGAALRDAVAATGMGPVTAVIHGAGTLADKRVEAKRDEDIAAVYATKVQGLRAMLSAVDPGDLTHLALFSSIAGLYGNAGQSDYAAANEVLNKFAHQFQQRYPACRTVVFDWGPWDGGMVTPFLKSRFEASGVRVLPVEAGARAFVDALCGERPPVQLVVDDVGPLPAPPQAPDPRRAQPVLRVSRRLGVEGNPFLRDHVIAGHPVLPAACAALWMANLCQQSDPALRVVALTDFRVLKGVVFDDAAAERYRVEVTDVEDAGDSVTRSVVIASTTREQKPRYHYRGTVHLARSAPDAPALRRIDLTPDARFEALEPYADGSLFHGPTFRAITRVLRLDADAITVACRHPRSSVEAMGQFPPVAFDAVVLDAMIQSLGLWAHHRLGAAALPTSLARYEVFAAPPADGPFYVTAEVEARSELAVRAAITLHDADGRVLARALGVELTVHRAAGEADVPQRPREANPRVVFDARGVARALRAVDDASFLVRSGGRVGVTRHPLRGEQARRRGELLTELPPLPPSRFGAASFLRDHGVACAYMAGAMAKAIASEEMVIALGRAGLLGSFGAGGLPIERIEQAVVRIEQALGRKPHAYNLLHSPRKLATEDATVDVYLKHGVRTVEASSYVDLTPSIVRYRLAGLRERPDGTIERRHRVIAKLSRVELARRFLLPPPGDLVHALLASGRVTREQAALAAHVPMADDVTFEADSGGHTDGRPLVGLLPAALRLRDEVQRAQRYPSPVRVGAAGGIGTPQAVLAAFTLGADYVVTGSINQSCVEAGTSAHVKRLLCDVDMADVAMSPDSDLFEFGGRVQVARLRSLFPMRAHKLYACYQQCDGVEAIPADLRRQLEQQVFRDSLEAVWEQTARYLAAHRPEELARAGDPKVKLALLFKWYMGQSSRWAIEGAPGRELDYQVWCGPAMGAFNAWARGTYLEAPENRRVVDVARVLMREAAYLARMQALRLGGLADALPAEEAT